MLTGLNETGTMTARSGWGFAATPALVEFYTAGDEDEIATPLSSTPPRPPSGC